MTTRFQSDRQSLQSARRFHAGKMRGVVLPFPEQLKARCRGEATMTKESDVVVLAHVRLSLSAARPTHLKIIKGRPADPHKTGEVLKFTDRNKTSAIKP